MAKYACAICGYVHDEAKGGAFDSLPDSWTCPVCGAAKSQFRVAGGADDGGQQLRDGERSEEAGADDKRSPGVGRTAWLRSSHRLFGYVFLVIYVLLIVQMVPRLWSYQIEFPARTVVHIALGMAVGVMLLLKIGIVRYFRRLDPPLVPLFGTWLLVASVILIGISVPWAYREAYATARLFTPENRQRVERLLAQTGLEEAQCQRFATAAALRAGRGILRSECVDCHDLRTVLAKPRTPVMWRQTVQRMAARTMVVEPLEEEGQWQVTAYLVALSPQLQRSMRQLNDQQEKRQQSQEAAESMVREGTDDSSYDADAAASLVAAKCSQCHDASLVADAPPSSAEAARELVSRMVDEGLDATADELSLIVEHLRRTYVP